MPVPAREPWITPGAAARGGEGDVCIVGARGKLLVIGSKTAAASVILRDSAFCVFPGTKSSWKIVIRIHPILMIVVNFFNLGF